MPLNPEARRARARLAAHRRWHPGEEPGELTAQCRRELELSAIDDGIDALAAKAPKMTAEQRERLVREVVDAMPQFTPEQRARLRPILAGTLPARKAVADAS